MMTPQTRNPAGGRGFAKASRCTGTHSNFSPTDNLLQRLEAAQKSGDGWRARCPACGGQSRKLAIKEGDEGRCLLHCFGCGDAAAVLQAVGLSLADLYPVRLKPQTPEERRTAQRAARQSQWGAALEMLALESSVALIAAGELLHDKPLDWTDYLRLAQAYNRIQSAKEVLRDPARWKPEVSHG